MRICKKCGAYYPDDRTFCIDCNEKLGDILNEHDEKEARAKLDRQIQDMYNSQDPFYIGRFEKVMGMISLAGAVATLAVIIFKALTHGDFGIYMYSLVLLSAAFVEALMPRIPWELQKMRLHFSIMGSDYAEPSDYYAKSRKGAIIVCSLLGIALLVIFLVKEFSR